MRLRLEAIARDPSVLGISAGILLAVTGFAMIAWTWAALSSEEELAFQLPLVVSGAIGGLATIVGAACLIHMHVVRRLAARRRHVLEDLAHAVASSRHGQSQHDWTAR